MTLIKAIASVALMSNDEVPWPQEGISLLAAAQRLCPHEIDAWLKAGASFSHAHAIAVCGRLPDGTPVDNRSAALDVRTAYAQEESLRKNLTLAFMRAVRTGYLLTGLRHAGSRQGVISPKRESIPVDWALHPSSQVDFVRSHIRICHGPKFTDVRVIANLQDDCASTSISKSGKKHKNALIRMNGRAA